MPDELICKLLYKAYPFASKICYSIFPLKEKENELLSLSQILTIIWPFPWREATDLLFYIYFLCSPHNPVFQRVSSSWSSSDF